MKTSFISSYATSQSVRYQMTRMQADLIKAEKEVVTGRVADPGLHLGARTGQSLSVQREMGRLKGIIDTNAIAAARMSSTQSNLTALGEQAEKFLSTLVASSAGTVGPAITRTDAVTTLDAITGILNTNLNGENLFAGVNTDVRPINDFSAPGSPNRAAFEAAFATHFGFAHTDPETADITGAEMRDFLENVVEPYFLGAGWEADWSHATDEPILSRITLNETAHTSVSANIDGIRRLAMATATVAVLFEGTLGTEARSQVLEHASGMVGLATANLTQKQAELGIVENRVTVASERLNTQINIFELTLYDMEGVDAYEASTRVSLLLAQIETSYTLTSRMRQLSLVRYLP